MKKSKRIPLGLLLSISFVFASFSVSAQTVDSIYDNGHYKDRMEVFHKMPHQKKAIVFLGNSITEAGKWQEMLPGMRVINRGISGDITFGVLARLPEIVAAKPSKIFLLIGVNDLKREVPVAIIIQNYKRMIHMIRHGSPHTKIYLQSVLPVNDSMLIAPFKKVTNQDVGKLNESLRSLVHENRVYYVNLHEVFADEKGQLKKEETPDGLHVKIASYVAWVKYLRQKNYL